MKDFKRYTLPVILLAFLLPGSLLKASPVVVIETNVGDITLQLDETKAPKTVANFLHYVEKDGYRGTIFHRVIAGFMIQGGGHLSDMSMLEEEDRLYNEAENGLRNDSGTIAMARENAIDSASRQFFINMNDNNFLNHQPDSCTREDEQKVEAARERGLNRPLSCKSYGYAVFGRVIAGMDVARKIESVSTGNRPGHENVPIAPVIIKRISILPSSGADKQ